MITSIHKSRHTLLHRILSVFIAFTFITSVILPPSASAQVILNLPAPGAMVTPSAAFTPALINGITIHPENPLEFDFIVGAGDQKLQGKAFESESTRLIKYFLASLTVPEDEMWVNLSPYEKDRIIPQGFGTTEMGRDLLAQDYILKQLTASLMYPEKELGSAFWKKIYQKAYEQYGTTEIPMNTFNKVWIVPEKAVVYERGNSAFVVKSHLKVMLEADYVAANSNVGTGLKPVPTGDNTSVSTEIIREVILPELEKEVNEGQTFVNLRQIYNSVILATWFKQNLKQTLLGQVYVDKTKTKGVDVEDKGINQKIYDQYLEAFKKGVYNYIKEDYDPATKKVIPRKYFSGGTSLKVSDLVQTYKNGRSLTRREQEIVGEFLARQEDYNGGIFNINLVELSGEKSAAEVQDTIAASRATNDGRLATNNASSPVTKMMDAPDLSVITDGKITKIIEELNTREETSLTDKGQRLLRQFLRGETSLHLLPHDTTFLVSANRWTKDRAKAVAIAAWLGVAHNLSADQMVAVISGPINKLFRSPAAFDSTLRQGLSALKIDAAKIKKMVPQMRQLIHPPSPELVPYLYLENMRQMRDGGLSGFDQALAAERLNGLRVRVPGANDSTSSVPGLQSSLASSPVVTIDLTARPGDINPDQTVLINHFTVREKYTGVGLEEDLIDGKKDLEQAKQQMTKFLEAGRNISVAIGEFPSGFYDGEDIDHAIGYEDYNLRRFPESYDGMVGLALFRGIVEPGKIAGKPPQIIQEAIRNDPFLAKLADLIRQVEPLRYKLFEELKGEYADLFKAFGYSQDITVEEFALSELRSLAQKILGKTVSKNEKPIEESSFEELKVRFDDMLYGRGYKWEFDEEYFAERELYTKIVKELSNKAELENAIRILFAGISMEQMRNMSIIYQPIEAIKYNEVISPEFQELRKGYILKALADVMRVNETELANLEIQVSASSPVALDEVKEKFNEIIGFLSDVRDLDFLSEEINKTASLEYLEMLIQSTIQKISKELNPDAAAISELRDLLDQMHRDEITASSPVTAKEKLDGLLQGDKAHFFNNNVNQLLAGDRVKEAKEMAFQLLQEQPDLPLGTASDIVAFTQKVIDRTKAKIRFNGFLSTAEGKRFHTEIERALGKDRFEKAEQAAVRILADYPDTALALPAEIAEFANTVTTAALVASSPVGTNDFWPKGDLAFDPDYVRNLARQFNAPAGQRGIFEALFKDGKNERGLWARQPWLIKESLLERIEQDNKSLREDGVESLGFLGMGGESSIVGPSDDQIINISSTAPGKLKRYLEGKTSDDLKKMRWYVVSKSGGTTETKTNAAYLEQAYRIAGLDPRRYMTYVTDPGTAMEKDKRAEGFQIRHRELIADLDEEATTAVGGRNTLVNYPTLIAESWRHPGGLKNMLEAIKTAHTYEDAADDPWIAAALAAARAIREYGKHKLAIIQPESIRQKRWLHEQQNPEESLGKTEFGFTMFTMRPDLSTLKQREDDGWVFVEFRVDGMEAQTQAYARAARIDGHTVITIPVKIENSQYAMFASEITAYGWMKFVAVLGGVWGINFSDQPPVEEYKQLMRAKSLDLNDAILPAQAAHAVAEFEGVKLIFDGLLNQLDSGQKERIWSMQEQGQNAARIYAELLRMTQDTLDVQTLAYYDDADEQTESWIEKLTQNVLHEDMGYAAKWGEGTGVLHGLFVNWFSGPKHQIPTHIVATEHAQPGLVFAEGAQLLKAGAVAAHLSLVKAQRPSVMLIVEGKLDERGRGSVQKFYEAVATASSPVIPGIVDAVQDNVPAGLINILAGFDERDEDAIMNRREKTLGQIADKKQQLDAILAAKLASWEKDYGVDAQHMAKSYVPLRVFNDYGPELITRNILKAIDALEALRNHVVGRIFIHQLIKNNVDGFQDYGNTKAPIEKWEVILKKVGDAYLYPEKYTTIPAEYHAMGDPRVWGVLISLLGLRSQYKQQKNRQVETIDVILKSVFDIPSASSQVPREGSSSSPVVSELVDVVKENVPVELINILKGFERDEGAIKNRRTITLNQLAAKKKQVDDLLTGKLSAWVQNYGVNEDYVTQRSNELEQVLKYQAHLSAKNISDAINTLEALSNHIVERIFISKFIRNVDGFQIYGGTQSSIEKLGVILSRAGDAYSHPGKYKTVPAEYRGMGDPRIGNIIESMKALRSQYAQQKNRQQLAAIDAILAAVFSLPPVLPILDITKERVLSVMAQELKVMKDQVGLEDRIDEFFGAGPMMQGVIKWALEDEFSVELPNNILTAQDYITIIKNKTSASSPVTIGEQFGLQRIFEVVRGILVKQLNVLPQDVKLTSFLTDLGADDDHVLDIERAIENAFNIKIGFEIVADPLTVQAYVEFVAGQPASSPVSSDEFTKGGIDLNPALLDLQIKRDGNGVPLPLPMQPIKDMHIEGFLPVIINVTPITNLPLLLGIVDRDLPTDSADSGAQPLELGFAVKEN